MSGSRSTDAQITSSLMGSGHHMTPFSGASDRLSSRGGGIFHDPTPALSQLSAYARPHIGEVCFEGSQDLSKILLFCMNYN